MPCLLVALLCLGPATALSGAAAQAGGAASATVLVMDVSGSMNDLDASGVRKIEAAQSAADNLLTVIEQDNAVQPVDHLVGLVAFANMASQLVEPTDDVASVQGRLSQLSADGGTNIGHGLEVALDALEPLDPSVPRYIILMTDGMPTEGLQYLDQFVAGPVGRAQSMGVCIYTVGFGTPGDLDEELLRGIARESGCGEYYFADAQHRLAVIYSRVRHETTGEFVETFQDTLGQGETKELGTYEVQPGQAQADFTLWWPGSVVDLILTDPAGQEVAEGYPGANLFEGRTMRRVLVDSPAPGEWRIETYGREVPEGIIEVDVIVSTRPATVAGAGRGGAGVAFVLFLVVAASVGMYLFSRAQRSRVGGRRASAGRQPAGVTVLRGPGAGQRIPLARKSATIGRAQNSTVYLNDPAVSPHHATLRFARGHWYIYDENSASGTFVNGQRVQAVALNPGDRIAVGGAELQFTAE